jgi:hypothetical protein
MEATTFESRLITCPECEGKKGDPPDEPCERCGATGEIETRPLESIVGDLRRAMAAQTAGKLKATRLWNQHMEAEDEQLQAGIEAKRLNRELLATIGDGDE